MRRVAAVHLVASSSSLVYFWAQQEQEVTQIRSLWHFLFVPVLLAEPQRHSDVIGSDQYNLMGAFESERRRRDETEMKS